MVGDAATHTIDDEPTDEEVEAVERGLAAFNASVMGPSDRRDLKLVIRDADGVVRAGLIGDTARGWLYIETLWVDEAHRGLGWGSRLLERAEREATARGCRGIVLDTASYQAPEFYRRRGYVEYASLRDYVPGYHMHYLKKELVPTAPGEVAPGPAHGQR